MNRFLRGSFIVWTVWRYGLHEMVLSNFKQPVLRMLAHLFSLGRSHAKPRGERLRLALEGLGPIFVKFGQVMSTRRDLLPEDIAEELAKLQDRVPPSALTLRWPPLSELLVARCLRSLSPLTACLWPVPRLRKCILQC